MPTATPRGRQGLALYRARTAAGLTQAEAAQMFDLARNTWARYEREELKLRRWALRAYVQELKKHKAGGA